MTPDTDLHETPTGADAPGFTLRDFLRIVFKHWRSIATTTLVVSATLGAGLMYLPPTYVAEAKLLVQTERQASPSFFGGIAAYRESRDSDPVIRRLETEMEMLSTRTLSEGVVHGLGLRYEDVFHPAYVRLLNPVADLYDRIRIEWLGGAASKERYGYGTTVAAFNKSFTVAPAKSKSAETTSNIIMVQLRAPDPKTAKEALQRLLDGYVEFALGMNQSSGVEAYKVVQHNLDRASLDMENAEGRLRAFLANVPATERSGDAIVRKVRYTRSAAAEQPQLPPVPDDETGVRVMRTHLMQAELKLAEARRSYQDDSETVRNLRLSVGDLRSRIQKATLESAIYRTEQIRLEREMRTAEETYSELNKKLSQIALFLAANPRQADVRAIVEPPLEPRSSEWRKSVAVWLLGSIGGLVLGFGLAGMRAYGDHTLQGAEDVLRHLGLPLLATVPALRPAERRSVDPASSLEAAV
jgi:uncharacterized protein involved in exopolysaccharide biosynthesis